MNAQDLNKKAILDILTMTTLSASGHPGGSMSSLDILFASYRAAGWGAANGKTDPVIVSNGHIAPGVYVVLGHLGVIPLDDAIAYFRLTGSPYEGHIENHLEGIPWSTGNLGQGLSAGCGFALSKKIMNEEGFVYVVMGDAEQAKGQVAEARKFAKQHRLNNIIALIDRNHIQISGRTENVMNVDITRNYEADGWKVITADGHDLEKINGAIQSAQEDGSAPYLIIAETVMGKGIDFMEGKHDYHGKALTKEEYGTACKYLGVEPVIEKYSAIRKNAKFSHGNMPAKEEERPFKKPPKDYKKDAADNRGSFGSYLSKAGVLNPDIAVFDCDLSGSVKTDGFAKNFPNRFFEAGVMEHNIATAAGALSRDRRINVFWADFGMFNIAETYNQLRLNDINEANLNIISTHVGIDVGEDGKTHQSIDYIGLAANLFRTKLFLPADFNQTQHIMEYVFSHYGNKIVAMGRSKLLPVTREDGEPFYGAEYQFAPGGIDLIREGHDVLLVSTGQTAGICQRACDLLRNNGIDAGMMHTATPLMLSPDHSHMFEGYKLIVTAEDHNVLSGLGAMLSRILINKGNVINLGIGRYFYSGTSQSLYDAAGISEEKILSRIKEHLH